MSSKVTLSSGQFKPAVAGEVDENEGPDVCGWDSGCCCGVAEVVAMLVDELKLAGVVGTPLVSSVSVNWPSARPIIPAIMITRM